MQSKVSMVAPCYNKDEYIGEMLESVCNQVWDNIELILVNDGSTDGTRDIIAQWEPKLRGRGYDVVIVDQENQGVGAATRNGMLRITGEYACQVDCDDAIYPEYVSTMASFLQEHPDYEWACCAFEYVDSPGAAPAMYTYVSKPDEPHLLENFLFRRIDPAGWTYLYRRRYLDRCRVVENFCTEPHVTQETSIVIPLAAGKGRLKFFPQPLYRYNCFATAGQGRQVSQEHAKAYSGEYYLLERMAIERLNLPESERIRLLSLLELARWKFLYLQLERTPELCREIAAGIAETLNRQYAPSCRIAENQIPAASLGMFFRALEDLLIEGKRIHWSQNARGRVVGYGALGKIAAQLLPLLHGTGLEPDLLWDMGADSGSTTAGRPVSQPEFQTLTQDDTLLIFPAAQQVSDEVKEKLQGLEQPVILHGHEIVGVRLDEYLGI